MKTILKYLSVLLIRFLQKRYKSITLANQHNQTNQVLAKLKLIQHILYFFKQQFQAWGYFHPDCVWSAQDEVYFDNLFPERDFKELDIVVRWNPEAVTYYECEIYRLNKGKNTDFPSKIENQLKSWKRWN